MKPSLFHRQNVKPQGNFARRWIEKENHDIKDRRMVYSQIACIRTLQLLRSISMLLSYIAIANIGDGYVGVETGIVRQDI